MEIPIDKEMLNSLNVLKQQFKDMYGNNIHKNKEAPYIFWNIFDDKKTYSVAIINMMRKNDIPEDLVYAYYKTGRILTEDNQKYLTKSELQEYRHYCREYRKLMKAKVKDSKCNIIQFVSFANEYLYYTFNKLYSYLP